MDAECNPPRTNLRADARWLCSQGGARLTQTPHASPLGAIANLWRPLTAHTSIVCVTRLKLVLCPFLGYKTGSIFGRRMQPATHKPRHRHTRALLLRCTRLTQTPHASPRGAIADLRRPLTAHTSIVCVTRLKLVLCPFLGYKTVSIFGSRMQPATHKPTRRRTLALFPRWCAFDSNTTCIALRSDREPLVPAHSAYFNSVRH